MFILLRSSVRATAPLAKETIDRPSLQKRLYVRPLQKAKKRVASYSAAVPLQKSDTLGYRGRFCAWTHILHDVQFAKNKRTLLPKDVDET